MALVVVTGPVRSGKSAAALELAAQRGAPVVIVAGGEAADDEMSRRIRRHQAERPAAFRTLEARDAVSWVDDVRRGEVALVDCLGALVTRALTALDVWGASVPDTAEKMAEEAVDGLVRAILDREGDTIVVANEVGWGVVPVSASGRLFRDVNGRATRRLVDAADAAYLVVAGRCIDLRSLPSTAAWPDDPDGEDE
ncbi:MAG: bifunctional adenosylcobinamide kinase/adenosylcobinamide-phosphate guanylyltransferase [Coriobacteriia bacterium]